MTCSMAFRSLHAPCIAVPREQATSMSCDTGCSVWREETLNPSSCHPATIRFASTRYELTAWPLYGGNLERCQDIPSPVGSGWCTEDGKLVIDWMGDQPAPQAVLEVLSCQCSRSCKLPSCSCVVNGLKCTDMCRLQDCTKKPEDVNDAEDSDW